MKKERDPEDANGQRDQGGRANREGESEREFGNEREPWETAHPSGRTLGNKYGENIGPLHMILRINMNHYPITARKTAIYSGEERMPVHFTDRFNWI